MTKKKKKKPVQPSARMEALLGRKHFSIGSDSMIRQAQKNYNGSYISGDLGGVSVSNPSLVKYYKGKI
jgi:hypothetical protein